MRGDSLQNATIFSVEPNFLRKHAHGYCIPDAQQLVHRDILRDFSDAARCELDRERNKYPATGPSYARAFHYPRSKVLIWHEENVAIKPARRARSSHCRSCKSRQTALSRQRCN